jgi:subtilisin family serine protease
VSGRRRALAACACLIAATACGCALGQGIWSRDALPLQLRSEQIIVVVPLVAPTSLAETARFLAQQYDLVQVAQGFALPSLGAHCLVFELRTGADVERLLRDLARHPGVRLAQRNQRFETRGRAHSDPYAALQHAAAAMQVECAHALATGRGVRIGIVDTGVDRAHLDLQGRIVAAENFVQDGEDSFATDLHGTAVAGAIAARADNGVGIYGVAPEADLIVAKACWHPAGDAGRAVCSSWTLARAIDYMLRKDVQVLNLSLGGPPDRLLGQLLDLARERSILAVAAAGERPSQPSFPASLESVLAVTSSEDEDGGAALGGVAAPGRDILTTAPGSTYQFQSGSSFSAAQVSGLVALLLEVEPRLSLARLRTLLGSTPEAGRSVDACRALRALRQWP